MAVRVTAADVKAILDNSNLSNSAILTYITSANTLVNRVLGTGDTAILKEIERWLTAHMIASTRERQAKKEEAGGAKIEYFGEYQAGLYSTSYGQMVLALDDTGKMAALIGKLARTYAVKSFV